MRTIEVGGNEYRVGKLDAKKSFHVARRLSPVLASLAKAAIDMQRAGDGERMAKLLECVAGDLSSMSDESLDYVIDTCLTVVSRKQGKVVSPVMSAGALVFDDIEMDHMLHLTVSVVMESLGGFFGQVSGGSGLSPS